MDWIEQLFGLNPDQGSGTFEVLIIGVLVAVALAVVAVAVPSVRERVRRIIGDRAAHVRKGE